MTYPTIFDRLRSMQTENGETLQALIAEACDVGNELVLVAERALNFIENTESEHNIELQTGDMLRAALAKARRCPDGQCTEKCA